MRHTILPALLVLGSLAVSAQEPAPAAAPVAAPAAEVGAVQRTTELLARYGASIVEVAWTLRRDAEGRTPNGVLYRCPNCGNMHSVDTEELIAENRTYRTPGFALAQDRFLAWDPMFRTANVERVEIRLPGKNKGFVAHAAASYPGRDALLLATDEPIDGVKPLEFPAAGKRPEKPAYFFVAREDGLLTSGVRTSSENDVTRDLETGRTLFRGSANALLVDASNQAVTVSFLPEFEIGPDTFAAPTDWASDKPDALERAAAELEARLARGILPVFLQLDPKAQEERERGMFRNIYSSDSEEDEGDERDLGGLVLEGGAVLIPTGAGADAVARLQRIEATLPDGTKAALRFEGALRGHAALIATFEDGVPAGVEPISVDATPVVEHLLRPLFRLEIKPRHGAVNIRANRFVVEDFEVDRDDRVVIDPSDEGADIYTADGRLVQFILPRRRTGGGWRREVNGLNGDLLTALIGGPRDYDPEIVPRKGKDRIRVAWFGTDLQPVTSEIAREKGVTAWVGMKPNRRVDTDGALVAHVHPGSPADRIGVREGDVLLFVRSADGAARKEIEEDEDRAAGNLDWERVYEQAPLQLYDRIPFTPWPGVGNGADTALTAMGIGSEVVVEWARDGELREAPLTVEIAPPHFRTATRSRSRALGLIVADTTFEVRGYYRLAEGEGGVVITRCKAGSPADVAGLRPFELIMKVDDAPVTDVRSFLAAVKDKDSFSLTVRRLTATRVVRMSVAAQPASEKDDAKEAGTDADDAGDE